MLLLDGGTFKHMVGVNARHLACNVRTVKPYPVATARGIVWLNIGRDLIRRHHVFRGRLINDHLDNTLLSEGWLRSVEGWRFESWGTGEG